jgi:translocation and assembly module TamB
MNAEAAPPPASPPPRRRPSLITVWGVGASIALALLLIATVVWVHSERALQAALDFAVEASGGKLAFEGVAGTLAGEVRVARITWRDGATDVRADNVVLSFTPSALVLGKLVVRDIHVERASVTLPPGSDAPLVLPDSLAPPLPIEVGRLRVGTIDWRRGESIGQLRALALAYTGDARGHRVRDLAVEADGAALSGAAAMGARRPYEIDATATLDLAAPHPAGRVQATAKGSLDRLAVAGTSTLAGVAAQASVNLAPLAPQPLLDGRLQAREVDLAALDGSWPSTRLDVVVEATPAPGGFTGTLTASNEAAGPLDRSRIPLSRLEGAFALRDRVLVLDRLAAQVRGGGTLAGSGTVALDGWRNRWRLTIASLDLAQIHSAMRTTRLAGRIDADVQGGTQRVSGEVAQDDLSLAFDARYDGRTLVADRFAARAKGGALAGTGRIALAGDRPFAIDARAERFDPARFGDFPEGSIDGSIRAEGTVGRAPDVKAEVVVAPGSKLAGAPLQGRARGRFTTATIEALDADVTLGSTRVVASGSVNRAGQPLTVTIASRNLAEWHGVLPRDLPALAGSLDATLRIEPRGRGVTIAVDASGRQLRVGDDWSATALRVQGHALHDAAWRAPRLEALADVDLAATGTAIVARGVRLDSAKAKLTGAAGAHELVAEVAQGPQSLAFSMRGSTRDPGGPAVQWQGRVESLVVAGVPAFPRIALAAPAALELARGSVRVGAARFEGSGTQVDVDGLAWREGRLETRGRFTGLALAPLARHAGVETRWPMDLVLGGRWDVVSVPQWKGTITIERERGDVYVDEASDEGRARLALGLSALRVDATFDGPRLAMKGELHARLAGSTLVDATAEVEAASPHPFSRDAKLAGTLRAHVPSLASLQPWIGTIARVRGQAIAELSLGGTLGDPAFTGQLVGYGLHVDMPQYGIRLSEGHLRAVSSAEGIKLEEFEFTGGDGRFTATGTLALPRERGAPPSGTRIAWRAENFRLLNHPDRRLIVDGEGTFGRTDGRWLLAGRVVVEEGIIAYRSTSDTELASDIVVVGRERPARRGNELGGANAPLDLELSIDLGRNFRFAGEGLETRLAGKLELVSRRGEPITGRGTIRTSQGTYYAFGQRLTIDRGRVTFDGPVANPSLEIVALRKNLAVEAGVEITGTVRAPVVRLTSNPPVPDSEKLSWLLTGGPPGSATQGEALALQAAQAALAGRDGKTLTQRFAQNLGLDDISLGNRGSGRSDDPLTGQVVTIGKRLTDRLAVAYEQGLEFADNVLRLEYTLSRYFTVSAYAGTTSGVELRFRRNWP